MSRPKMGAAGRRQPAPTARQSNSTWKRSTKRAQPVSPAAVRAALQFYAPSAAPRRRG